jgi:hypothetical protein
LLFALRFGYPFSELACGIETFGSIKFNSKSVEFQLAAEKGVEKWALVF